MPYKKGECGNRNGRPKTTGAYQEFRKTSYEDFINKLQKYGAFTSTEMKSELNRPDLTMFESMFAQIVVKAAAGDKDARGVILERLWGKVFYKADSLMNPSDPIGDPNASERPRVVLYLPTNGREAS